MSVSSARARPSVTQSATRVSTNRQSVTNILDTNGNPVGDWSDKRLENDADKLAEDHHLPPQEIRKGAFLTKYETDYAKVPDLQQDEIDAMIIDEKEPMKGQNKILHFTIVLNSVAAAIQGWDQTGSNGANLYWPKIFDVPISDCRYPDSINCDTRNLWIVGFVNSTPYVIITILACWLSDPINHYLGRRLTIFLAAIFSLIAPVGSALTQSWPQLVACRALLGIGMGLKEVTVPILSAEIAPRQVRGQLVMSWQLCTAAGILLGAAANLVCLKISDNPDMIWRLQLGSAFIPAIPLVLGVIFCPESPRWLIKRGRIEDAYESLVRLRKHKIQAARDLYYIRACLAVNEESHPNVGNAFRHFRELFTKARIRRATIAASIVMTAQQLCGVNIFAFYSANVFDTADSWSNGSGTSTATQGAKLPDSTTALALTVAFGAMNFFCALPAIFMIDRFGRRVLLLYTLPIMSISILIAGFCFWAGNIGAVATFIIIFVAFYSLGLGPIPFTYSAEVFPISHREIGMGWAVAVNNFFGAVLALTFPYIFNEFSPPGALGFFAGLNGVAFLVIFLLVPETKRLHLEYLDHLFGHREFLRRHVEHQVFEMGQWQYQRIFRPRNPLRDKPQFP